MQRRQSNLKSGRSARGGGGIFLGICIITNNLRILIFPLSIFCSIPTTTVKRLMAAVSFGYGLFHLAVSLLPPKLLNVIHFLGFEGDRQTGIQALLFSRQGDDMRGPLAT